MGPVQPVGTGVSQAQQTRAGGPADAKGTPQVGATATTGAATSAAMVSSTSVSAVYSQVDAMLGAVGGGVQDNQLLRMIIGLLILQVLMGADGGSQQAGAGALLGMLGANASGGGADLASLHSATNVIQIEQQSTLLTTSQAVLASTATEGDPNDAGSQVDVEA